MAAAVDRGGGDRRGGGEFSAPGPEASSPVDRRRYSVLAFAYSHLSPVRRQTSSARGARFRSAGDRRFGSRCSRRRASGIAAGVMLNSVSPRPTSSASSAGSDAISPQSDTGIRCRAAARRTMTIIRRMAGWSGSYSCDTRASARSTARQVLNQVVGADREEVDFARDQVRRVRRAGTSIIAPTGTRGRSASVMPSPPRPRGSSRRASRNSSTAVTNGNMMRRAPCLRRAAARAAGAEQLGLHKAQAKRRAACRRLPASRCRKRPDRDRAGLPSSTSNMRTVTGRRHPFEHPAIDRVCSFLRAPDARADQQKLRAVQADAFGAGIARRREVVGKLDVRVEADAHAVGGHRRARPARPASRHRRR